MKVLILGANGMAGHVICKHLKNKGYEVHTLARSNADIKKDVEDMSIVDFFSSIKEDYTYIINCIGLLVKDSIERPDRAAIVNSWFPHMIEQVLKDSKTRLIHLSTDCVFNGAKGNYIESDIHTETNSYGKSKSYGEINNDKDITFRMSIIGTEKKRTGTGLLNWILNSKEQELNGWQNAYWNGVTTLQLAKCLDTYMKDPKISGIYHLVNNNVNIDKYNLLCKINKIFNLDKTIIKTTGPKSINKILVDTRNEIDFQILDYDSQLNELKDFYNS